MWICIGYIRQGLCPYQGENWENGLQGNNGDNGNNGVIQHSDEGSALVPGQTAACAHSPVRKRAGTASVTHGARHTASGQRQAANRWAGARSWFQDIPRHARIHLCASGLEPRVLTGRKLGAGSRTHRDMRALTCARAGWNHERWPGARSWFQDKPRHARTHLCASGLEPRALAGRELGPGSRTNRDKRAHPCARAG